VTESDIAKFGNTNGFGKGIDSVRATRLAECFVGLADTLVDDFDVVDLMEVLVATCGEVLHTSAAGLLLNDPDGKLHVVASSSEETRVLELMQLQNAEGPCFDSVRQARAITAEDLHAERDRWPIFVAAALDVGYVSVHAMPLRLRTETIGSLNLFRSKPPALSDDERRIAQALADVATIGVLQHRAVMEASELAMQLQIALDSRVVIEQAKGVLAERRGLGMPEAFELLRGHARRHNVRLAAVAEDVVLGRSDLWSQETPDTSA
jgi:GAF domain-containing protein